MNNGDIVKFTNDKTCLQGRVSMVPKRGGTGHEQGIFVAGAIFSLRSLNRLGFTAEVVEVAEFKLPEVAGIYRTDDSSQFLQLIRPDQDEPYWSIMGRDEKIAHRELPYSVLPLVLVMEV